MKEKIDNQENHGTALRRPMIAQLVINGNLISNGRINYMPSTGNIIVKADLTEYDTINATIIHGDLIVDDITLSGLVLVTGVVSCKKIDLT